MQAIKQFAQCVTDQVAAYRAGGPEAFLEIRKQHKMSGMMLFDFRFHTIWDQELLQLNYVAYIFFQ